jgi:hypothetical protein
MRKTVATTVAGFPIALAVALACRCAAADEMVYTAREKKLHPERPRIDYPFQRYNNGHHSRVLAFSGRRPPSSRRQRTVRCLWAWPARRIGHKRNRAAQGY